MVRNCGHLKIGGSSTWQAVCHNWERLRVHLQPRRLTNWEEWINTLLWSAQVNMGVQANTRRLSKEQIQLHQSGIQRIWDIIIRPAPGFPGIWQERRAHHTNEGGAFLDLTMRIHYPPDLDRLTIPQEFFMEDGNPAGSRLMWKYLLPPVHFFTSWIPFMD